MNRTIERAFYQGGVSIFTLDEQGKTNEVMFIHADGTFRYEKAFDTLTDSEIKRITTERYKWYRDWEKWIKTPINERYPMPKC